MRRVLVPLLVLVGVGAALAGCATGVGDEDEYTQPDDGAGGGGGAGGGHGTTSGAGAMGGEAPEGGMGGAGGDETCIYDSPNACATAETLPNVAGDEGGPTLTEQGVTSMWFAVQITEEVSDIFEEDLSYTVQLQSPSGMDFDLVVHQSGQDSPRDCNAPPIGGTDMGGGLEQVHGSWDDDQGLGGEDDPVWLSIEVIYASGTACDASAQWTLTVQGHT